MSSYLKKMMKRELFEKGDCKFLLLYYLMRQIRIVMQIKMNMYDYFIWDYLGFVFFYVIFLNGIKSVLNMLVGYECV